MTVADDVQAERDRQDAKWGEQNHIDGTGPRAVPLRYLTYTKALTQYLGANNPAEMLSAAAKEATDVAAELGAITWRDILLEEVFEAFAEQDEKALRAELVQVAAVAQQWVEAIDRRATGSSEQGSVS